nr:hypothetical protein CFP56_01104 [Quercus suber]
MGGQRDRDLGRVGGGGHRQDRISRDVHSLAVQQRNYARRRFGLSDLRLTGCWCPGDRCELAPRLPSAHLPSPSHPRPLPISPASLSPARPRFEPSIPAADRPATLSHPTFLVHQPVRQAHVDLLGRRVSVAAWQQASPGDCTSLKVPDCTVLYRTCPVAMTPSRRPEAEYSSRTRGSAQLRTP